MLTNPILQLYKLDLIPKAKNKTCLDVGCGDGSVTEKIKEKGYNVMGCDIDKKRLEVCKSRGIKTFRVDLESGKLPFSDESIDLVTSLEVISYLRNPENVLREVYRVLKPNEVFIASVNNIAWWYLRLKLLFGRWAPPTPEYVQWYSIKSMEKLLRGFGFKISKKKSLFVIPGVCEFPMNFLHSLSYNYTLKCVK